MRGSSKSGEETLKGPVAGESAGGPEEVNGEEIRYGGGIFCSSKDEGWLPAQEKPLLALLPPPALPHRGPPPNTLSPRLPGLLEHAPHFRADIVAGTPAQKGTQLVILGTRKVSGNLSLPRPAIAFPCKLAACFLLPYFPKLLHSPDWLIFRLFLFLYTSKCLEGFVGTASGHPSPAILGIY